jgi:hypothetical protein
MRIALGAPEATALVGFCASALATVVIPTSKESDMH